MSYRARVFDHSTGAFLLECRVTGETLGEAESRAIAKAALCVRGNPAEMDVRHLHELRIEDCGLRIEDCGLRNGRGEA